MTIIAIDGESIHPYGYRLLQSSSGRRLSDRTRRLSTAECFEFLLHEASNCDRMFGYGIGYDVCHWIADLTDSEKTRLAKTGRCYTLQGAFFFRLRYVPGVYFQVERLAGYPHNDEGKRVTASAMVVDLMRWHRKPFIDVAEEWGCSTHSEIKFIKGMKKIRGDFVNSHPVELYCETECRAERELAEQMLVRLKDIGVPSSHPFTSGSVAGQLASKHRVHEHWQEPPPAVSEAVQRAFYGGREQVTRYGLFRNVVQWDIRSAYGWALMQLPDMTGHWARRQGYPPLWMEREWGLIKVSWDLDEGEYPVMPFPHRAEDGRVHYPPRGTGWYWSPIVRAALRHYKGDIKIIDAWKYVNDVAKIAIRPFSYIGELYENRKQASIKLDPVEGLIKMLIVSTWGRLCSPGSRKSKTRGMLDWAGMTTALIHERMINAINETGQEDFISCCVDGFWTTSAISPLLPAGYDEAGIGQWSMKLADELLLIRPTCYWKRTGGEWTGHTSGIQSGERYSGETPDIWRFHQQRGKLRFNSRTMRGLLSCANTGDFAQMGQFFDNEHELSLNPGFGLSGHECPTIPNGDQWRRWLPYWPPIASREAEGAPFVSRTGPIDTRWKEAQMAQEIEEGME